MRGQSTGAVRLFGGAATARETLGAPLSPMDHQEYSRITMAVRSQLSEAAFASAWADGCAMSLEQAISYALTGAITDER